jgi:cyclic pyranopterin phosphate synthase
MSDTYRIDGTKIHFHPRHVAAVIEADTWDKARKVAPLYWEITTSAACPHRCTFCSTDAIGYPAINMDAEILMHRMREAANLGTKSVMFAGTGEPLLHKKIDAINESAVNDGLDTAFTTNGVLLHKLETLAITKWVKISLNAGTRESYAAIHRTDEKDWERVWANIKEGAKRKGKCALGVQAVVLPENVYDMGKLALLTKDAGADYLVLKPYSQATFMLSHEYEGINYREWENWLTRVAQEHSSPDFEVIYRANAMRQEGEGHRYDKCRATPMTWVYSMADGRVFSCSAHLLDERFCIGNLKQQTFQEVWHSEERRQNWELMQSFDVKQCRLNCRQNHANIYYDQLISGVPHQNFI